MVGKVCRQAKYFVTKTICTTYRLKHRRGVLFLLAKEVSEGLF